MLVNTVAELGVAGSGFSGLPGDNSEEHHPRSSNTHPLYFIWTHVPLRSLSLLD
jgi:hypothetical protein